MAGQLLPAFHSPAGAAWLASPNLRALPAMFVALGEYGACRRQAPPLLEALPLHRRVPVQQARLIV